MRGYLLLILQFFICSVAAMPENSPFPGGVAVLDIGSSDWAKFENKDVMVLKKDNRNLALLGIGLKKKPGEYQIETQAGYFSFNIKPKTYPSQHLTIKNKNHVNPPKRDLDRIFREKREMGKIFTNFRLKENINVNFSLPSEGIVSSEFGLRRYLNGQARSPHSGIDIAAAQGTSVYAPSDGIVSMTGDYFFNGKTVLLDHGQGLITMYCHLSKITVAQSEKIKKGAKIGEVGMTGRVTGAHLHWAVSLNNVRVNPRHFLNSTR